MYFFGCLPAIHCNAARSDGKWHNARVWSVYTSKGLTPADALADCLARAAIRCLPGEVIRADWSDGDVDFEEGLYILRHTLSPASHRESLYGTLQQKEFMMSEEEKAAITRQLHVEGIFEYLNTYVTT